ncbi:MAG: ABC transporter substrate-binding protein [Actinomycetota bacterium]|nr:ABC transporter substrate-binding protein [Actinomycetota bacterium]
MLSTLPVRGFDAVAANTLVWVHDVEPPSMHYDDPDNRLAVTSRIRRSLIEGLYGVSGATEYYPELLAEEDAVGASPDGSIVIMLKLRDGLRWSNGGPLTARDIEYTWNIWKEGCALDPDGSIADGSGCVYSASSRTGLDLVTGVAVVSDTEFTVSMSRFYAGWRGLFGEIYHPSFGADAAAVNSALAEWRTPDGQPLLSSGPMVFAEWERGFHLALVRNDAYHGSASPDARNRGVAAVDGVFIRFLPTIDEAIRAIEGGQAQVIMAQPKRVLGERLAARTDFTIASAAGPVYEHWGFNLLNPHLADPAVREAIAYAVDKAALINELYEPLFGAVLPEAGLGNTYWMTNQRAYEDHQLL